MSDNWSSIRKKIKNTSRKSPIFLLQKERKPIYGMFVGEPHAVEHVHNGRETLRIFVNFYMTEPGDEMRVLSCCPEMFKAIDSAIEEHGKDKVVFGIQKVLTRSEKNKPWINFEVFMHAKLTDDEKNTMLTGSEPFDLGKVSHAWKVQNG